MLKSLIPLTVLAMLAGCATTSAPRLASSSEAANAHTAPCLTTGTRIIHKEGECSNAAGRVYTKDDLDRTGAFTPAEALMMLDPAFNR